MSDAVPSGNQPLRDGAAVPLFRRPLFWVVLIAVLAALIVGGTLYWLDQRRYESTDDAFVDAHIVRLAPTVAGTLAQVADVDNRHVAAGTLLAVEPDEDEGPEWPKLTPGQKAGAEPQFDPDEKPEKPGISTDPGTSIVCLPPSLKAILNKIVDRFGAVKVTSTWRPPWRARRGSYHKRCEAMDFRVPGVRPRTVLDYARSLPEVGGNKVYWNGLIHIDTGPRRPW